MKFNSKKYPKAADRLKRLKELRHIKMARSSHAYVRGNAQEFYEWQSSEGLKEYDLYVPLFSNGGKRLPRASLTRLRKRLVAQFGGLTFFPQKLKGVWKIGHVVFQDEIVILRVLSEKEFPAFWKQLKKDLQREWNQREILIIIRHVSIMT